MLGFTLLETAIVLCVFAIVLGLMIPAVYYFFQSIEEKQAAFQLLSSIRLARNEALLTDTAVSLDPKPAGFQAGYVIHSTTQVFDQIEFSHLAGQILWRAFPLHQANVVFMPNGLTQFENGTFWYCRKKDSRARWAIVINQAGRARLVLDFQLLQGLFLQC